MFRTMTIYHRPVLLREVVDALRVVPGAQYIDGTVGEGGHAEAVLLRGGRVLGLDANPLALRTAQERFASYREAFTGVHANFRDMAGVARPLGLSPVQGVLLDLGLSALLLEGEARGFTFQRGEPLDMRFNPEEGPTAADLLNTLSLGELEELLRAGGERRYRHIAKAIMQRRPLRTTGDLVAAVTEAVPHPMPRHLHPATLVFQAVRMAVNEEAAALEAVLPQAVELLAAGGRLVVISYHSGEDAVVKRFLQRESRDCICPPAVVECVCGHKATLRLVNRKVVMPTLEEIARNPRSRSARMRIAERL